MEIIWNGSIGQIQAKFIGVKFLRAHSKFKKRKKNLSSSIYVFYKTSRLELLLVYHVKKSLRKILLEIEGNTNLRSGPILTVLIHSLITATAKNWLFTKRIENWAWSQVKEHDYVVRSSGNLREQRNIWKGSPVFPDGIFQTEIHFLFLIQSHLRYHLCVSDNPPFVQMVHAIPGRNLPFLNFAYLLPKPWTDPFAH